jgi:hypothetical protein
MPSFDLLPSAFSQLSQNQMKKWFLLVCIRDSGFSSHTNALAATMQHLLVFLSSDVSPRAVLRWNGLSWTHLSPLPNSPVTSPGRAFLLPPSQYVSIPAFKCLKQLQVEMMFMPLCLLPYPTSSSSQPQPW